VTLLLLDTTLLIDRERGATELEGLIGDDDDVTIAAVTLAELTVGVELAGTRQRARHRLMFLSRLAPDRRQRLCIVCAVPSVGEMVEQARERR
jgi:predicted nucleic acid-binding protein